MTLRSYTLNLQAFSVYIYGSLHRIYTKFTQSLNILFDPYNLWFVLLSPLQTEKLRLIMIKPIVANS